MSVAAHELPTFRLKGSTCETHTISIIPGCELSKILDPHVAKPWSKRLKPSGAQRRRYENFHGGGSFSDMWWSFVFGVRCLRRHNLTSYSCFQTHVLAKFVDIVCIFFYTHSPYFMCHCTEYKLLALQVEIPEENNSTPRHSNS